MYYINPATSEVHSQGACSWQQTIADWNVLGSFISMAAAVAYARSHSYSTATRCEHCVE